MGSQEQSGDLLVAAYILLNERSHERQVAEEIESKLEQTGRFYRSRNGTYYLLDEPNVIENRLGRQYVPGDPSNCQEADVVSQLKKAGGR